MKRLLKKTRLWDGIIKLYLISLHYYMRVIHRVIGVKSNKVVFKSVAGNRYSGNPKAISEKLHEKAPDTEIVWLFKEPGAKAAMVPDYVRMVESDGLKGKHEMATAKVWVDNFCKENYLFKGKDQKYIQTWHGDMGFKRILYDSSFVKEDFELIESRECDMLLACSDYGARMHRTAFRFDGLILKKGYPRNDILVENSKDKASEIKKLLHIPDDRKIVIYAPTLRRQAQMSGDKQQVSGIDLLEVLEVLNTKTEEEWICLVRAHTAIRGLAGIPDDDRFYDVTSYEEMNELLLISDFLITDYSSCAGDFSLLERPVILFQDDRSDYMSNDRSFYFDIDESPYRIALNQSDLVGHIMEYDFNKASNNSKEILEFYGCFDEGTASDEVVDYIMNEVNTAR